MPRLDARFPGFEGIEGAPGLPPPVDARSWVAIAVGNTLRIDGVLSPRDKRFLDHAYKDGSELPAKLYRGI